MNAHELYEIIADALVESDATNTDAQAEAIIRALRDALEIGSIDRALRSAR